MNIRHTALLLSTLLLSTQAAHAQAPRTEPAVIKQAVSEFLEQQAGGLPGEVKVTVGAIDPRMNLAPCPAPQAFLMPGARAWGKTTVGVRCAAPAWTIYVQAMVSVQGEYVTNAVPLAQGQTIEAGQLA